MLFDRPIADSHVHIDRPFDEKKLAEMLEEMREVGVCDLAAQSLAAHFKYDIAQNLAVFALKRDCKDITVRAFASLHERDIYSDIPYEKQAEALLDMGADGFKFIQMKPDVRKHVGKGICHESYDKVLSLFEERGTPMTLHTADPDSFWDANGEKWVLEQNIAEMLEACAQLLSDDGFLVLNLYSMGLSSTIARTLVRQTFGSPKTEEFGELYFTDRADKELPFGTFYRMKR